MWRHLRVSLHPFLFWEIIARFGVPAVNLFSTQTNCQTRFFSRFPAPGAEGVDALHNPWPPLRLPPTFLDFQGHQEVVGGRGGTHLDRPPLALTALVRRPHGPLGDPALVALSGQGRPQPEFVGPPGCSVAPTNRLALERCLLRGSNLFIPRLNQPHL